MRTPVLIIGSGLAGLATAYRLAKQGIDCTVVAKDLKQIQRCNSVYAQGGIIYRSPDDSSEDLIEDIMAAGARINYLPAVQQLATEGVDLVKEVLIDEVGVPFDRNGEDLSVVQEAAHSRARIIHVKDYTGKAIMESLYKKVIHNPRITWLSGHVLVDILTSGHHCRNYEFKYQGNRCLGAFMLDVTTGKVKKVLADHTVLCTGGIGQIYQYHTNSAHAYGGGLAAANRARVRIINSRFVQFHPTALWSEKKGRRFLISETLRGEGARLMNQKGEYFMDKFPLKDLESRAVVSKAIMEELNESGEQFVYLNLADHYTGDLSISERFPSIQQRCLEEGTDINKDPIPVVPAEHFFCGGIVVDLDARTDLDGLYAAGEVACTGVHGANRLASTSLLECLTWGVKAADDIGSRVNSDESRETLQRAFDLVDEWKYFGEKDADDTLIQAEKDKIRSLMWNNVGIIRTKEKLYEARDLLREWWSSVEKMYEEYPISESLIELRHMAETAYIITNSASSHTSLIEDNLGGHVLKE